MPVDTNLANFSDLAYRTAIVIYALAMVLSVIYYMRSAAAIEAKNHGKDASAIEAKANKFAGMTQSLVWLGIIVHAASVVLRGMSVSRFPWGNLYEYISLTMLLSMAVAAVIFARSSFRILWAWVLGPVILLMFYGGTKLYAESAPVVPALRSFWLPVHVSIISIGSGLGLVSSVASILFIMRSSSNAKMKKFTAPLPTAEKLDAIAYRTAVATLPVFGVGIILGAIWAEAAWGRFWGFDPKETMALVTWLLYAAYLHARATTGWKKTTVAWINVLAFVGMLFNLLPVNLFVSSLHSYAGLN
ncbi:c-type cytochrome biogenesis protein CcsB [Corynebacterium aquilae]|uniref:Cytochrome C biogenesis protein n=1 Tax=Corynebacterium aquilae DSM 44791 TaxID=1431546 RepID=A0A1L7CDP1_9CORY|nr:c-type cytochrome biogenesis protein CcsB [Corynebacterium aquilae]APT83956.1 cytochrome C biogenesis protein [Corynebacterium aquilae DSM 44791]